MRVIFSFYRNFIWFVTGISMFGCYMMWLYGSAAFMIFVFWVKIVTNILLGLYVNIFHDSQFYFYYNLGFSRTRLFAATFMLDMLIWILMSVLTITIFL